MVQFHVQILTNFTYHVSKNQFSRVTNLTCLNKGAKLEPKHSQQYIGSKYSHFIWRSQLFPASPLILFPSEKRLGDEVVSGAMLKGVNEHRECGEFMSPDIWRSNWKHINVHGAISFYP